MPFSFPVDPEAMYNMHTIGHVPVIGREEMPTSNAAEPVRRSARAVLTVINPQPSFTVADHEGITPGGPSISLLCMLEYLKQHWNGLSGGSN